jgi:hypothetical protein
MADDNPQRGLPTTLSKRFFALHHPISTASSALSSLLLVASGCHALLSDVSGVTKTTSLPPRLMHERPTPPVMEAAPPSAEPPSGVFIANEVVPLRCNPASG